MMTVTRARLLASAAMGIGLAMVGTQPAQAACVFSTANNPNDTVTCGSTTTTDTTGIGPSDRNYSFGGGIQTFLEIDAGAVVDGFGLAWTQLAAGANETTVTNDGVVQVNAGNTPTAGGSNAALSIASGDAPVTYFGGGSVINNGTGHGIQISTDIAAGSAITYLNLGNVTSTTGNAIDLTSTGGEILVLDTGNLSALGGGGVGIMAFNGTGTTSIHTAGTINADAIGIAATTTGDGWVVVDADGAITSVNGDGIDATSTTGAVTVSSAAITAGDFGILTASTTGNHQIGVTGAIDAGADGVNALSNSGNINIATTAAGTITAGADAIIAQTGAAGTITVDADGAVTSTAGSGVTALTADGAIDISSAAIDAAINGIAATSAAGDQTIVTGGAINAGTDGIVTNSGTGDQQINVGAAIGAGAIGVNATSAGGNIGVATAAAGTITAVGDAIFASAVGAGTVNVAAAGAVNSTGGDGIYADSVDGAITVASAAITAANDGIQTVSTTGAQQINVNGPVDAGAVGVSALSNGGNIGVTTSATGTITAVADAILATTNGAGTVTVNAAGAIDAGGNGINVMSADGAITVASTAAITATASGIAAVSTTGNQTITANGPITSGAEAIIAVATTGNISVNINADVTSTASTDVVSTRNDGVSVVNVAAGSVVTGAADSDIINFYGNGANATLNNSGTIGDATNRDAVYSGDPGVTINNLAGGVINGAYDLAQLDDTINNGGTINIREMGFFGGGTDALNNQAGGTVNIATGTSLEELETFTNAGTVNLDGAVDFTTTATVLANSGTFNLADASAVTGLGATTSSGTLNAGAGSSLTGVDAFTNSGTLNTAGDFSLLGYTSLANSGTMDLAPGVLTLPAVAFANSGTIVANGGATNITGQTTLANSGTLNMQDGAPDDVLVIDSDYAGSGASALNVDASAAAADLLLINGAASGSTVINVNPLGGAVINSDGVMVVDAGTSTADAFTLGTSGNGLLDFSLQRIGEDFFLFAAPNANAFDPLALVNVGPDMWHQSAEVYGAYAAQRRSDLGGEPSRRLGLWGQIYWGREHYGERRTQSVFGSDMEIDERIRTKRKGVQVGVDYHFGGGVFGVTGGWERADANLRATSADIDLKGWNLGAYTMVGSDVGFYGGLLLKYDHGKADFDNAVFDGLEKLTVKSWGVDLEGGYRFALGNNRLDFGGGLAWVDSKIEDFSFGGISYDYDSAKSLRGRLGLRFEGAGRIHPYADARLMHEFRDGNRVRLASGAEVDTLDHDGRGTWGRFELGLGTHGGSGPMAAVWADVGDVQGWGLRAGWRFGSGRAAMPETPAAPPPPPQPAPPATQSCPDGSVILATDACPVQQLPEAPPPPPAPQPENG